MNQALKIYRPASNRITTLLVTLLVIGFGLFAEAHVQSVTASDRNAVAVDASAAQGPRCFGIL